MQLSAFTLSENSDHQIQISWMLTLDNKFCFICYIWGLFAFLSNHQCVNLDNWFNRQQNMSEVKVKELGLLKKYFYAVPSGF